MKFDCLHVCLQMDKASILGDAIDYVIELKKEVMDIETEVAALEQKCSARSIGVRDTVSNISDCSGINLGNFVAESAGTMESGGFPGSASQSLQVVSYFSQKSWPVLHACLFYASILSRMFLNLESTEFKTWST